MRLELHGGKSEKFGKRAFRTSGQIVGYTEVDDDLYDRLNSSSWCMGNSGYPVGTLKDSVTGRNRLVLLHRLVWLLAHGELPKRPLTIDHVDRDPLNNQLSNLRIATPQLQSVNQALSSSNRSGFRGVFWEKLPQKWGVAIQVNGKRIRLGQFRGDPPPARPPQEAIDRYEESHRKYFGCDLVKQ